MSPFLVAYYLSGAWSRIKDRCVIFDEKRFTQESFALLVKKVEYR